nr:hypothetical protein [Candidatus Sigynarchaeota archaeon]
MSLLPGNLQPTSKKKSKKSVAARKREKKASSIFKKSLFVFIFALTWAPLLMPLFDWSHSVPKEYSAWNYGSSGTSGFREQIIAAGYTDVKSSVSSFSLLSRIDEPFVLVVMGPNRYYNLISDIPFMIKFLKTNGSMLVAHDQGSTSSLFFNAAIASLSLMSSGQASRMFPFTFFMDGVLRDNVSYYINNSFPVIDSANIFSHPIMNGVNKLVLNHATGIMMLQGMESFFGWNILATSTNRYSWVDKAEPGYPAGDSRFNISVDNFAPHTLDIPEQLFSFLARIVTGDINAVIPQGGFPIPVVAATELSGPGSSRVVVTADASMFSNQMIGLSDFDNLAFGLNCIDWLTGGNTSRKIIFDEAHLRPVALQDMTVPGIYGQVLDYISFMSSNWIVAPFYPFIALSSLKRWLPKSEEQVRKEQELKKRVELKKEKRQLRKAKQERQTLGKLLFEKQDTVKKEAVKAEKVKKEKTLEKKGKTYAQRQVERKIQKLGILKKSTFFAQKLAWYMEQAEFNRALELLYNRVRRLAAKKLGENVDDKAIIEAILDKFPQVEQRRVKNFFTEMKNITSKGSNRLRVTKIDRFEKIYYEMMTIGEYIEKL